MAWYDSAVFYQIHPLSLFGCEQESANSEGSHFAELAEWAEHAKKWAVMPYILDLYLRQIHMDMGSLIIIR